MGLMGLRGAIRSKEVRTTVPNANPQCPLDRVNRQFKADRPNQLWVSDFTHVSIWRGSLYVSFITGVYAHHIVGRRVSRTMHKEFVLDKLVETIQSFYKVKLIHHRAPWETREADELATLD